MKKSVHFFRFSAQALTFLVLAWSPLHAAQAGSAVVCDCMSDTDNVGQVAIFGPLDALSECQKIDSFSKPNNCQSADVMDGQSLICDCADEDNNVAGQAIAQWNRSVVDMCHNMDSFSHPTNCTAR